LTVKREEEKRRPKHHRRLKAKTGSSKKKKACNKETGEEKKKVSGRTLEGNVQIEGGMLTPLGKNQKGGERGVGGRNAQKTPPK